MAGMTNIDRAAMCARNVRHPIYGAVRDYVPHFMSTLLAIRALPETGSRGRTGKRLT